VRVLVVYAHPNPESFGAALHRTVLETLRARGHEVEDLDLYATGFDPVLGLEERLGYHALPTNRAPVEQLVAQLERAEALVLCFPVWNFGYPAILKGYFDRVFLPGVSFDLVEGRVRSRLANIRRIWAVTTYGATRLQALFMLDPPRVLVTRLLSRVCGGAKTRYLAHYDMNRATPVSRAAFLERVRHAMEQA
jgi:NAD(P)H dehydrogenase (quinone)